MRRKTLYDKVVLITIITERVMTANGCASFLIFNNLWSESISIAIQCLRSVA